jgi:hypothetical protein
VVGEVEAEVEAAGVGAEQAWMRKTVSPRPEADVVTHQSDLYECCIRVCTYYRPYVRFTDTHIHRPRRGIGSCDFGGISSELVAATD